MQKRRAIFVVISGDLVALLSMSPAVIPKIMSGQQSVVRFGWRPNSGIRLTLGENGIFSIIERFGR